MSELLRQFFQRGRGTAPVLHPRLPSPFEGSATGFDPLASSIEQDFEADFAPIAPSVPAARSLNMRVAAAPVSLDELAPAVIPTPASPATAAATPPAPIGTSSVPATLALPPVAHPAAAAVARLGPVPATDSKASGLIAEQQVQASPTAAKARRRGAAEPQAVPGSSAHAAVRDPTTELAVEAPRHAAPRAVEAQPIAAPSQVPVEAELPSIFATSRQQMNNPGNEQPVAPAAAAPLAPNRSRPEPAAALSERQAPLAAAAPPPRPSDQARSQQLAEPTPDSREPQKIEIRIGRIDVQVPLPPHQAEPRPAAIGMSLDAFIAETRQ